MLQNIHNTKSVICPTVVSEVNLGAPATESVLTTPSTESDANLVLAAVTVTAYAVDLVPATVTSAEVKPGNTLKSRYLMRS